MIESQRQMIGFACSYTPVPLLHAAGLTPYRVLPLGVAPDEAGYLLHDNICPHVKRILDRAVADDLPPLAGMVLVNSCDAMRRLADAWRTARPDHQLALIGLPVDANERSQLYFAAELHHLAEEVGSWSGTQVTDESLAASSALYADLVQALDELAGRAAIGSLPGGRAALQELLNRSVTTPPEECLSELRQATLSSNDTAADGPGVPVLLFGNVLPDRAAFELFESAGVHLVGDDMCTGSRQLVAHSLDADGDPYLQLAGQILRRPPCARTVSCGAPGGLASGIVDQAREVGARGVIAHVVKFCDPYLARLPGVREALRDAGLPLLVLEGDCTMGSLGQQRTRVEAFAEMLGGGAR